LHDVPTPVVETLTVAPPNIQSPEDLNLWARSLATSIIEAIQQHGFRINQSIHQDGGIVMANPLVLQPLLVADLPAAADWEGGIVYVSDGGAGAVFRGSDGTNWVNLG